MSKYQKRELAEKRHFDKLAMSYDENYQYGSLFTQYKIDKKADELIDIIDSKLPKKKLKILEVGCGTGEYTKRLAKKIRGEITCLDISGETISLAKSKCKDFKDLTFKIGSIYKSGFKDNYFDVVCGFYVLHHLDMKKTKEEIIRILKPGGIVFFYEPNILNPMVYVIKSNRFIKEKLRESPDEWAINPLKIKKQMTPLKSEKIVLSEFVLPFKFLSASLLIKIDKIFQHLQNVPLVKYLGGSVMVVFRKQ